MANLQSYQTISQIIVAVGIIATALGGYGAYHFGQKLEEEKESLSRPFITLCNKGISVKLISGNAALFDIPYCSGKNANAYKVKLETAILVRSNHNLIIASDFSHKFPEGITLSYETGKSISFTLTPFPYEMGNVYICVKGTYSNEKENKVFPVCDIYKYNKNTINWQMVIGEEFEEVYSFIN